MTVSRLWARFFAQIRRWCRGVSLLPMMIVLLLGFTAGSVVQRHHAKLLQQAQPPIASGPSREELRRLVAQRNLELTMEQTTVQQLQRSLGDMEEQRAQLREEVALYRRLMAPERVKEGLAVDTLKVFETPTAKVFSYRVTLAQYGNHALPRQGRVTLHLETLFDGQWQAVPATGKLTLDFGFRYFQVLNGTVELPDDTRPQRIRVTIDRLRGKRWLTNIAEQTFLWQPRPGHS